MDTNIQQEGPIQVCLACPPLVHHVDLWSANSTPRR